MNAEIYDNSIDNVRYGIRMSLGSSDNNIYRNTFNDCSDYGLYTYEGSDEPTEGVSDGRPSGNHFYENVVSDTAGGVKFKYSDNLKVTGERLPPFAVSVGHEAETGKAKQSGTSTVAHTHTR